MAKHPPSGCPRYEPGPMLACRKLRTICLAGALGVPLREGSLSAADRASALIRVAMSRKVDRRLRVHQQSAADVSRMPRRSDRPALPPNLVRRQALLKWFSLHRTEPVVGLFAPAGYGKTTLLGQAAEADERPVGWVSLDDRLNDPIELMTHLAGGLDQIGASGRDMPEELRLHASEVLSIVPRLASAFASIERPAVLV